MKDAIKNYTDIRTYKVVRTQELFDPDQNEKLLLIEFAMVNNLYISEASSISAYYDSNFESFIFPLSSEIAQEAIYTPNKLQELDVNYFTPIELDLNEEIFFVYASKSNLIYENINKGIQGQSKIYIDELDFSSMCYDFIKETIAYTNIDMLFYDLLNQIVYREYNNDCSNIPPYDLNLKYERLATYLLRQSTEILLENSIEPRIEDIKMYRNIHIKSEDYWKEIRFSLYLYIQTSDDIFKKFIELFYTENGNHQINVWDKEFMSFFRLTMLHAYTIAINRMRKSFKCKNSLFSSEILCVDGRKTIKIFPTAYTIINMEMLLSQHEASKEIRKELDTYLSNIGLTLVSSDELFDEYKTKYTYFSEIDNSIYYFKRRIKNNIYSNIGEQFRKSPLSALLRQSQLNLSKGGPYQKLNI